MVAFLGFKVALLATVGFATFGASLLPFFLAQKLAGRTAMAAVAAASACSAGVVVGAWLCHMMPDASESFAGYLEDIGADERLVDYPFAGVCCGGVIALLVAVDALIVRGGMDGEDSHSHGSDHGGDGGSHDHITDSFRKLIERADASAAHSLPATDASGRAVAAAATAGGLTDGGMAGVEGYQLHTSPPSLAPPMRAVPSAAVPAAATAATALLRSPSLGTTAAAAGDASVSSGGSSASGSGAGTGYGATGGSGGLSRGHGSSHSHSHSKGDSSRRRGGTSSGGGSSSHAGAHDDDAVVGVELQVEKRRVEHPVGDGPDASSPDSPIKGDARGHNADDASQLLLRAAPAHSPSNATHHDDHDHHSHHHYGHHQPSAAQRRKKLLRAWVFFIALSLHGVFDGLSVGAFGAACRCPLAPLRARRGCDAHLLCTSSSRAAGAEDTSTGFSSTVIAVLSHKLFDGLSLGCALFPAGLPRVHRWLLLGICAATTPLGIGIGMAAEEAVGSAHAKLVTAIVLGLASGTFAYVSLMELLPSSLASPHLLRWKLLLFVAGFASMAAIAVAA